MGHGVDVLGSLLDSARQLTSSTSLASTLQTVIDHATRHVAARYGVFALIGCADTVCDLYRSGDEDGAPPEVSDPACVAEVVKSLLHVPVPAGDHRAAASTVDGLDLLGTRVELQGEVLGVLYVVGKCGLRQFTHDDALLLEVLAQLAALAAANAGLAWHVGERTETINALGKLTGFMTSTPSTQEAVRAVAQAATRLLNGRLAAVWMDDPAAKVLRLRASYADDDGTACRYAELSELPYGTGLIGSIPLDGAPVYEVGIQADDRLLRKSFMREENLDSLAAVPLLAGHAVHGVLTVMFAERRELSAEEKALLEVLADHAAIAIRKARLLDEHEQCHVEARLLAEIDRTLHTPLDVGSVLGHVARGARELCGADVVRVAMRDRGGDAFVFRHCLGSRYDEYDRVRLQPGGGAVGVVIATGRPARDITPDALGEGWRTIARHDDGVVGLIVPITDGASVEGIVWVEHSSPRSFTESQEAALARVARHAWVALHTARVTDERGRALRRAEGLTRVSRLVACAPTVSEATAEVARSAVGLLESSWAILCSLDLWTRELTVIASAAGPDTAEVLAWCKGVARAAAARRAPVVCGTGGRVAGGAAALPERGARPSRAILAVPVIVRDAVAGVLCIGDRAGRTFDEHDVSVADALGAQAAAAVQRGILDETLSRRRRETEVWARVAWTLVEAPTATVAAERAAAAALEIFDVPVATLRSLEPDGSLTPIAVAGPVPFRADRLVRVPPGAGVLGRSAAHGCPVWSSDTRQDEGRKERVEHDARWVWEAAAAVPLRVEGRVVGVLSLHARVGHRFSDDDIMVLEAFGDKAALAVETVRRRVEQDLSAERLRVVAALSELAVSSASRQEVLSSLVCSASRALGVRAVAVWVAEEQSRTLTLGACSDAELGESHPTRVRRFGEGVLGRVAAERRFIQIDDVFTDDRVQEPRWWSAHGLLSGLAAPVAVAGNILGVLVIYADDALHLAAEKRDLFELFRAYVAVVLSR